MSNLDPSSYQTDCSTSTLNYSNDEYALNSPSNANNNNSSDGSTGDTQASSPLDGASLLDLVNVKQHDDLYPTPASTENSNQSDESASLNMISYDHGNGNNFYTNNNINNNSAGS